MLKGTFIPVCFNWQTTSEDEIKRSVENALDAGYRLIDTAQIYGNEHVIGQVLKERFSDGRLKRGDIFITTKVRKYFAVTHIGKSLGTGESGVSFTNRIKPNECQVRAYQ